MNLKPDDEHEVQKTFLESGLSLTLVLSKELHSRSRYLKLIILNTGPISCKLNLIETQSILAYISLLALGPTDEEVCSEISLNNDPEVR